MNFNFPSLNINIVSELNDLFDEIIKIKKCIQNNEQKFIKAQQIQDKKIQIIHNLFNNLKNNTKSDLLIDTLLKSEQFSSFNKKINNMHKTYKEYRDMRVTSNNILEKSYNKLEFMNNDISEACKKIQKDNKILKNKIELLSQVEDRWLSILT